MTTSNKKPSNIVRLAYTNYTSHTDQHMNTLQTKTFIHATIRLVQFIA